MKNTHFILFFLIFHSSAFAQKISFGTHGIITYHQTRGVFDVAINGKQIFKNGYSEVLVDNQLISSRGFKQSTFAKKTVNDSFGTGAVYNFTARTANGIIFNQEIHTYPNKDFFTISVSISGGNLQTNQMIPLKGEIIGSANFTKYNHLFVPFDNDTFISYQADLLKPDKENISAEVTTIYDNLNRNGFVVGTLDHDQWKTGIKTKLLNQSTIDLTAICGFTDKAITRDQINHGFVKGKTIKSSAMFFGYFPDWRNGMETYAKTVRINEKPIVVDWKGPTPVGWNSWGAMQEKISYEKAIQVVDYFTDKLKTFRMGNTCYIDLDSYWDKMLVGNDFSLLKKFADYCKSKGLKPGIYWAPFTDWGFKGGPNRKAPGSNYNYGDMWTKVNEGYHDFDGARALDPTHPGTQKRIDFIITNFKDCGFEMIKIDFLGHAAAESTHFYDEKITTGMQAYRIGMEYLVKKLDNKMLIYAAISPSLASGRYVHVRRIACDAFKSIKDTEYTLNSVTNGWWQTYLYNYIDADHVVLGNESEGANVARTLSAIVTGTLIVGDDFSVDGQWKERAEKLFQNTELLKIIADGKSFRPVDGNQGKSASSQFIKEMGKTRYVALFNYENKNTLITIDFARLGFDQSRISSIEDLITKQLIKPKNYGKIEMNAETAAMLKVTLK